MYNGGNFVALDAPGTLDAINVSEAMLKPEDMPKPLPLAAYGGGRAINGLSANVRDRIGAMKVPVYPIDWTRADRGVSMDNIKDPDEKSFDYAKNTFVAPTIDLEKWLKENCAGAANFQGLTDLERTSTVQIRDALRLTEEFLRRIATHPYLLEQGAWDATSENISALKSLGKGGIKYPDSDTEKIAHSNQAIAISEVFGIAVALIVPSIFRAMGHGGIENETMALIFGNFAACFSSYILGYTLLTKNMKEYTGRQALSDVLKMEFQSATPTALLYLSQAKLMTFFNSVGVGNPEIIVTILGYLFYSSAMYNAAAVTFSKKDGENGDNADIQKYLDGLYQKYQGVIGYDGLPITA